MGPVGSFTRQRHCTYTVVTEANIITRNHKDSKASGVAVYPAVDSGYLLSSFKTDVLIRELEG